MSKEKSNQSLSDVYRTAWESCAALWPLFIVRLVFLILNIGALVLCLFLACWPFIQGLFQSFRDSSASSLEKFFRDLNPAEVAQYFPDLKTILLALGLGLLYLTWWSFLSALFDGAVYARLRAYRKEGSAFSLGEFFKDGIKYMIPMIGLQCVWVLMFLAAFMVVFILGLVAVLLFHLLSIPWWIGLLLGVPAGFAFIALLVALAGYGTLSGAYLVEDRGIVSALKRSFNKCGEGYGRAVWGILLVWVIYFVFSLAFQGVMSVFGRIPLVGALFSLGEFLVNLALSIGIWVYIPALAVTFSLEKEA